MSSITSSKPLGNDFFEKLPVELNQNIFECLSENFVEPNTLNDRENNLSVLNAAKTCKQWQRSLDLQNMCAKQNLLLRKQQKLIELAQNFDEAIARVRALILQQL